MICEQDQNERRQQKEQSLFDAIEHTITILRSRASPKPGNIRCSGASRRYQGVRYMAACCGIGADTVGAAFRCWSAHWQLVAALRVVATCGSAWQNQFLLLSTALRKSMSKFLESLYIAMGEHEWHSGSVSISAIICAMLY